MGWGRLGGVEGAEVVKHLLSLVVGDNEPYHGRLENDCMHRHGTARGLAHVLIEVRNDLLATPDGVSQWCDRIAGVLEEAMADAGVRMQLGVVKRG